MKTKTWIVLLLGLLILSVGLSLWLLLPRPDAAFAEVSSGGKVVCVLDLSIDRELTVTAPGGGENTLAVRQGRIGVIHADCPDGVCIAQGFCSGGRIICLPNRLVIRFLQGAPLDAVAG